jgi:type VI protein secretion system component VasK
MHREKIRMNKIKKEANIQKIEAQVERWDTFARIVPIVFLGVALVLICLGVINYKQAFWTALGVFAVTAVTWWFWTIYTIRHLVHTLHRASGNLHEVREEFKKISKEVHDTRPTK